MYKASIGDLHDRTSELVEAAAEGNVVIIERDGEPVAELRPIDKPEKRLTDEERQKAIAKMFVDMEPIWKSMPQVDTDSGRFLEEDRS
jgi:antitoxin (DNA-binding transcriptional repressor) of toxin-antitoxin stability system